MKELRLLPVLLLAILSMFLVSCGDDDDDVNVDEASLVGTWQCTWSKGYEKYQLKPEWNEEWDQKENYLVVIDADGTFTANGETGEWILKGNKLTLIFAEEEEEYAETATIVKFTSSELVIEIRETEQTKEEGKCEFYQRDTYKRIK